MNNDAISRSALLQLCEMYTCQMISRQDILKAPAIDAVPVVHKKDIRSSVITVKDCDGWQDRIILADEATQVCAVYYADGSDAVPVVRCKSCMKRSTFECPMYSEVDGSDYGLDIIINDRTDDDGYCHCGARMDGEAE